MEMIAHGGKPKNGKKGPSKKIAREFVNADKAHGMFKKHKKS